MDELTATNTFVKLTQIDADEEGWKNETVKAEMLK